MKFEENQKIFFKFNGSIYDGVVDEVTETKISMHHIPEYHGYVYTARLFEFNLDEYGKSFALTKEELK